MKCNCRLSNHPCTTHWLYGCDRAPCSLPTCTLVTGYPFIPSSAHSMGAADLSSTPYSGAAAINNISPGVNSYPRGPMVRVQPPHMVCREPHMVLARPETMLMAYGTCQTLSIGVWI